ncbi:hypothetical protein MT349_13330 [Rathayibacter caricis]|uniref:hypothetical protein n=1 Tax=Rathayibacter caricis TaxID=110936 RepID=UPI001FB311EF|nr:hypothetical protein [Rathayibacter caricis]MCJ1696760.1 hypothetical protein [Rathayibacter caricis]
MTSPSDLPLHVTERFALPGGLTGVSTWSAPDPERLEQLLRTRAGHPHPDREPPRRLHLVPASLVLIEESRGGVLHRLDPRQEARTDVRWARALRRSRRPAWLRRLVGPADLPDPGSPRCLGRRTERAEGIGP